MTDANAAVYERVVDQYLQSELYPSERVLLARVGPRWGSVRMLDLGVGAGRTAFTFAAICHEYVGIDYAAAMVARCRERLGETASARFAIGDARAMPEFGASRFDVVLFSFNGIDYAEHEARLTMLREIHRVIAPGGIFLFSSHSLRRFPFRLELPRWAWREPVRSLRWHLGAWRRFARLRWVNRDVDAAAARTRGWAVLTDEAHDFSLRVYYATAEEVIRQVQAAGFIVEAVLDAQGRVVADAASCADPWLHYLCRADDRSDA